MNNNMGRSSRRRGMGCRKPTSRGCLIGLAVFAVLAATGWYILMGQAAAPQKSSYDINISEIRQMARRNPDQMPTRLNVAVVGEGSYPQVLVMAGSGLQPSKMVFAAYQLVYADSTVVIDSTLPEQSYEGMFPTSPFDSQAYESIQKALQQSSLILLTHAHLDHIEGITRSPDAVTLVPKMFFTEEQMRDASTGVGMTAKLLDLTKTTRYEGYYSPAPGVVMMKSAGHSPGDQLIYVQLQGGIEFLLTGDVVWSYANITQATGRPLLFRWLVREDWKKNGNEIRALHNLAENESIHMLVSHDGPQLDEYIRQGLIGDGFE